MRFRLLSGLFMLLVLMSACQPSSPTVVYIVVSPTPSEGEAVAQPPTIVNSPMPTTILAPTAVPVTPTAVPTNVPEIFPTETKVQIQVAEQVFENGRMFWLQPEAQIWVMVVDEEGAGRWLRYEDNFVEGEDLETDPAITPPEGKIQPERGFGKLWRENPDVREALGWAITPEFGYISDYEYHPGGTVRDSRYVSGPGYHMLLSLNSEAFCFLEETGMWKLGC